MSHAETELSTAMRRLAGEKPERADELRARADDLDHATYEVIGRGADAKQLIGAWARARKLYCEITGEPLV